MNDNTRVYRMSFASVYPHYVTKVESKGRTKKELHQVIHWLTGYNEQTLQKQIDNKIDFETFFAAFKPNKMTKDELLKSHRYLWNKHFHFHIHLPEFLEVCLN